MNNFVKIYGSIIRSTVWQTKPHIKLTWLTLLILADSEGRVEGSIPGLAATTGVTLEQCEEALACFKAPDRYSRTKDHDGRRIVEIDGGWLVLNHHIYRDMRTPSQQKEAARQKRYRDSLKAKGKGPKRKSKAAGEAPPSEPGRDGETSRDVAAHDGGRDSRDVSRSGDAKRRSSRVSRADPDPDPDLEPIPTGLELDPARAAPRMGPAPVASPEYSEDARRFGDVQPPRCKVPPDYAPLERHVARCREIGVVLDDEVETFRTHEYPRPYSDFHARFDRWLIEAKVRRERSQFQGSQAGSTQVRRRPAAGILLTQPNNGATGWEGVDDQGDDDEKGAAANG